jgi:outer membrane lipoprotein carrier protein
MEEEAVKQRSALSSQLSRKKYFTPEKQTCRHSRLRSGIHIIFLLGILFWIPAFAGMTCPVFALSDNDIVNDIQKKFSAIKDLKGTFSQTSYLKDLEKTEKYSGTFYIKKPYAIMWEYNSPRDEKVFVNKTDTWIYKKSQKQAIKTRFSKETYSQVPIALLSSLDDLRTDFDISHADEGHLNLKPKKQMGTIREIVVETGPGSFPVRSLTAIDQYGNIIMIELGDIKINSGLEDSLFTFNPPPGVEVFDMSQ